jgi:hypothetical protein
MANLAQRATRRLRDAANRIGSRAPDRNLVGLFLLEIGYFTIAYWLLTLRGSFGSEITSRAA